MLTLFYFYLCMGFFYCLFNSKRLVGYVDEALEQPKNYNLLRQRTTLIALSFLFLSLLWPVLFWEQIVIFVNGGEKND